MELREQERESTPVTQIHGVKVWMQGTVSQICFIDPRFCFLKS